MDALPSQSLQPSADFLPSFPLAELHLHLEGSISEATLRQINPALTVDEIRARTNFHGFAGFLKSYVWVTQQLDTPEAYRIATTQLLQSLTAEGISYAEITLSAGVVLWKGQSIDRVYEAIAEACLTCTHVQTAWIFDAIRQFGPEPAAAVFDAARRWMPHGVVAIGLGGDEVRGPASWFRDLYVTAADAGLRLTCHAGETAGASSVREALAIGTERIGHGFRAIEDHELLAELRERNIPLEICLSSNVATGATAHMQDHPLRRLFEAGVPIVLGTDDPALFHTTLKREYALAADVFGFSNNELHQIANNALRYAFASPTITKKA